MGLYRLPKAKPDKAMHPPLPQTTKRRVSWGGGAPATQRKRFAPLRSIKLVVEQAESRAVGEREALWPSRKDTATLRDGEDSRDRGR